MAKDRGAHVIVLGVSDWIDQQVLYNIASDPYTFNTLFINDFLQFDAITAQLIDMICDSKSAHRHDL